MEVWIAGALLACAAGALIAFMNDCFTRRVMEKKPGFLASFFVVRQIINVGFLVALYFVSPLLPWGMLPVLIGGVAGLTVPALFFSARLARLNDEKNKKSSDEGAEAAHDREGEQDG